MVIDEYSYNFFILLIKKTVARLSTELYSFMKEKGVNPLTSSALPLIQVTLIY